MEKVKDEHKQLATFIKGGHIELHKIQQGSNQVAESQWLPCYGTAYDSPEVTQTRLYAWMQGSKMMAQKWISEKRYQELISCAHGDWYQDDVLFEPLAIHFVKNHLSMSFDFYVSMILDIL